MIDQIVKDARSFRLSGKNADEINVYGNQVELSFRNVGKWIHDEESGREREEEGDPDWREDDDNMILAPGEMKAIYTDVLNWSKSKTWFDHVTFSVEPSEKCWLVIAIQLEDATHH
jgi:hypothetical protein